MARKSTLRTMSAARFRALARRAAAVRPCRGKGSKIAPRGKFKIIPPALWAEMV